MDSKEDIIRKARFNSPLSEDVISFSATSEYFCVCLVDIVNSTNITARLSGEKSSLYYSIFLNNMAIIVKRFSGTVVKNIGDSLLYCFPKTSNSRDKQAFRDVIECGMSMIESRDEINNKMFENNLPEISYRISADYGEIMMGDSTLSVNRDVFGSTVNMCDKINQDAIPNTMVIGGDLYLFLKDAKKYIFKEIQPRSIGHKLPYSVYSVSNSSKYD